MNLEKANKARKLINAMARRRKAKPGDMKTLLNKKWLDVVGGQENV